MFVTAASFERKSTQCFWHRRQSRFALDIMLMRHSKLSRACSIIYLTKVARLYTSSIACNKPRDVTQLRNAREMYFTALLKIETNTAHSVQGQRKLAIHLAPPQSEIYSHTANAGAIFLFNGGQI